MLQNQACWSQWFLVLPACGWRHGHEYEMGNQNVVAGTREPVAVLPHES